MFHSSLCGSFGSGLCSERRVLLGALEAHAAGGCPRYGIAHNVGDRHDGIVEGRADVCVTFFNILPVATLLDDFLSSYFSHFVLSLLYYFFLLAIVLAGPFLVLALVLVL